MGIVQGEVRSEDKAQTAFQADDLNKQSGSDAANVQYVLHLKFARFSDFSTEAGNRGYFYASFLIYTYWFKFLDTLRANDPSGLSTV